MAGPFYFAWSDAGEAFSVSSHAREDEEIIAIELDHNEGDFATLHIDVPNPRAGLLASNRRQWCWLSWDDGTSNVTPLFNGRVVAVEESMTGEAVRLQFIAQPEDYKDQKAALAQSLMVLPYYDPVFTKTADDSAPDPDTALEARSQLWHVDRVSLEVTASDIITGEDGTIEFAEADVLYNDVSISYGQPPLPQIDVTVTVSWTQHGDGSVDLTRMLFEAFSKKKSAPYGYPMISSLTGDGLFGAWPKARGNIGGGWKVSVDSDIEAITFDRPNRFTPGWDDFSFTSLFASVQPYVFKVKYATDFPDTSSDSGSSNANTGSVFFRTYYDVHADFPVYTYAVKKFGADYESGRQRSEKVTFSLVADVQAQIDLNGADPEKLELTSDQVGEAIDFDGSVPIGDTRRKSYFQTDRGLQSLLYVVLSARAKLRARARSAQITFTVPWEKGLELSCRKSATITDARLPGGSATGKVTAYTLAVDSSGQRASVTIDCAVGRGGSVVTVPGLATYVEDYVDAPGQVISGDQISVLPGEVWIESLDDFEPTDDGVNLLDLRAEDVAQISVSNGLVDQCDAAVASVGTLGPSDPIGVVKGMPTSVTLQLVNLTAAFHTNLTPQVSELKIPKGIDLEAA